MKTGKLLGLVCLLTLLTPPVPWAAAQEADTFYCALNSSKVADEQEGEWLELVEFAQPVVAQRIDR